MCLIFVTLLYHPAHSSQPTSGFLWGQDQTDHIEYECDEIGVDKIRCDFLQTIVRKNISDEDSYQSQVEECITTSLGANPSYDPKICLMMEAGIMVFDEKITPREFADALEIEDLQPVLEMFNNESRRATAEYRFRQGQPLMCAEEITEQFCVDMIGQQRQSDAETCKINTNRFSQTFVRVGDTGTGVFSVEAPPTGPCGIINVSRFELDYMDRWNYTSQKVITNPNAVSAFGSCSDLDEGVYNYSWRPEDGVVKNCKLVKFGY